MTEAAMNEDTAREDIAFIRRTMEQGRRVAGAWSPDMLVWGVAVAIGYFGTYARVRGWWTIDTDWLWGACILLPWAYSLRRVPRRLLSAPTGVPAECQPASPLAMLWFACGISVTILGLAVIISREPYAWWMNAVSAGAMGLGFFASSFLCSLVWLRWVGLAWWAGELAAFLLRNRPEGLLLSGALMLVLLAVPGFVLMRGHPRQGLA
jgi:hypothetical protein